MTSERVVVEEIFFFVTDFFYCDKSQPRKRFTLKIDANFRKKRCKFWKKGPFKRISRDKGFTWGDQIQKAF